MKIKSFSKSTLSFPLPDLLDLQKRSWENFLNKRLKQLFLEISPISDYTGEEYQLWFLDYKLGEPNYKNEYEAKDNDNSYSASLKVRAKLQNLKTQTTKEQEVFLCDFPLMTSRGTFVINGIERVIVSQLLRSPGVFFSALNNAMGNNLFGAKIIPNRGSWLEFQTENSGFIGVKINRRRKVAFTTLLRAFGLSSADKIKKYFSRFDIGETKYVEETLKRDIASNQEEALVEVYQRLRPGESISPDAAKDFIFNMFFNFERYDLSEVGRWKFWQRLPELQKNKKITPEDRVLSLEDVLSVVKEIIKLNNDPRAKPDQIDHLGNRRVRGFSELLENRLRVGFARLMRTIKDRISVLDMNVVPLSQLINSNLIITVINQFFSTSQFAQFMDNTNPLSELEHKRRLTATGPGGLTRQRAGFEARDVQPSHYGKICPIQTPEGPNVGLVLHMACFAQIDDYGFLRAPYFKVKNGRITEKAEYLSAFEEERFNIATASIPMDKKGNILGNKLEARVKGEPDEIPKSQVDFVDVSSKQPISVATSLVPFLKNDDPIRALMGSNMQRQSVPLIKPEPPLIGTGTEKKVALDSGAILVSDDDGEVVEVDAGCIKIKTKRNILSYQLKNFLQTNQYTCIHQKPIVKKGQFVKKGDVLSDGPSISNGVLSLGKNILIAFLPWRGYNYEDAILVSERLIKNDTFTSITIEDHICDVMETKLGPEITTFDIPNVSEEKLKNLDEDGIIRVGAEVKRGDILVGKISPKGRGDLTSEERLLKAIFGEKAEEVKDTSLRLKEGEIKKVVKVRILAREKGHSLSAGVIKRIHVETAQLRKIKAGDKFANRHGNKGVISKIMPEEEMPFLADGTPVDIVLSPLGVLTRMNVGQIMETHLGLAAKKLGYFALTPSLLGAAKEDIKEELKAAGFKESGQIILYDGKTGFPFSREVTVGYMYMMKLIHMVEDKIHSRSIGPYSLITQQPLGGKAQSGGQRLGEMEVWALEGHGAAYTLQEMLTIKSDDILGRASAYQSILKGEPVKTPNIPASFNLFLNELRALGFDIEIRTKFEEKT